MIFPNLEYEPVVQVGDRTRLLATKSYASKGSVISKVEIEPDTGAGYIDVTGPAPLQSKVWHTDWQYASAGTKTISVKVNGGLVDETIRTFSIEIITEADDKLFATDADLISEEPDILKYVQDGRNSYKDVHREAQKEILDMINRRGYKAAGGGPITKTEVVDLDQVLDMAKYLALAMIYEGISNQVGDVFALKASKYMGEYQTRTEREILGLDLDGDDAVSPGEGISLYQGARLIRR